MKHKICEKLHFINRFKERIGIELTEKEYFELNDLIMNPKFAEFIKIDSRNEEKCLIYQVKRYKDFSFIVVKSLSSGRLKTVLGTNIRYLGADKLLTKVKI